MESMGKKPRRRRSFTPEFKAEIVGLSLTEPAAATFYTGAAKGYVDYKTFDQMAAELKA